MASTSIKEFAYKRIGELEVVADAARVAAQTRRIHRGQWRDQTRRPGVFRFVEASFHFLATT